MKDVIMIFKFFFLILMLVSMVTAQSIFPGQSGQQLLDNLVSNYKPSSVLGYDDARDKLYGIIYNENDYVECVYTGYTVYIPYDDPDPRGWANSASPILNCEHTWPKSKGAEGGLAESNMHHLYPTNGDANAARGSLPFEEIDDQQTDRWWKDISYITSIPQTEIDAYSEELTGNSFEPREEHKGNVARAMFYFYTMYKAEADAADPTFFTIQKNILKQWHYVDPADASEISRTNQIAGYQDSKVNPYVLDSTLVRRAFFDTTSTGGGGDTTTVSSPAAGVVYISEVSDAAGTNYEFIELYNNSSDTISLENSKLVRVSAGDNTAEWVFDFAVEGSGDTYILPKGLLIVDRSGSQNDFETDWGVTLASSVTFNAGDYNLYFGSGTARRWRLRDGGTENSDDGDLIDDTGQAVAGSGTRHYQDSPGSWISSTSSSATPGQLEGNQDSSLPVELTSFTVSQKNNLAEVELKWKTESELQNSHWLVEKRSGQNKYSIVGTVPGAGNCSHSTEYSYVDKNLTYEELYSYRLSSVSFDGQVENHETQSVFIALPDRIDLIGNYPNPFNPVTKITFKLPQTVNVSLEIYNILGQKLKTLVDKQLQAGSHLVEFNAHNLPSGIYYYRINAGEYLKVKKMILLR